MIIKLPEIHEIIKCIPNRNPQAIDLFISIIENLEEKSIRKECIESLNNTDLEHKKVFNFLESLLISDENDDIRHAAAEIIKDKYLSKALTQFTWIFKYESYYKS